jgi:hypothetical protein
MTESLVKAEKAQPANYAGMNYEDLCNYVKTQINLETRKQVGMSIMTHSYVTAMRELAKDEEIVYCFMNEMLMGQSPIMSKSKTIDVDNQMPTTSVVKSIDAPSEKPTRLTEKKLVDLAIAAVEDLPLPEGVSSKYSYYACYEFKKSNGELILDKSCGMNEPIEVLEKLKLVEPMRIEDHYKNAKTVVAGNYHVYLLSGTKCRVSHFNMSDGVEPYVIDYANMPIPKEYKQQVEEAKYWEENMASLPEDTSCESNEIEEEGDALWGESASGDSCSIQEKDVVSDEQRLIEKAVEMAKSRGVGMMTDRNAPYFVQDEFKVTEAGELERAIRPFSRNIRIDEFDTFKESHKKRAQTYNASYVSCTDDYTAYIIDGGKTVCVFYYNTTCMAAEA